MSNLRKSLIITLSTVFAVILCMTLIFSIRPTYASSVEILDTDGTSIYLSGEGVTYNKTTKKYSVENGSDVTVYIFNEQRIFSSVKVGSNTYNTSTFTLTNVNNNLEFDVYSTSPNPDGSDKGRYFSNPFVIHEDSQLKALEFILSGRTDANELDYYEQFNELGEVTNSNKETARKKLQFGYFVLSENILLDTNEFYGIGSVQYPFAGVFDFRGYHVTLNILNEYKNDYYELDAQSHTSIYSGLFGYVKGLDNKSSMIKDVDVNGKIAFSGTTGNHGFYHYVGGIAGHVEPTTLLAGANSEVSIAIENDTPLFIGGLFGSLKSPLNDQFNFTYKCNYGVLQAKSHGSDVNMSLGALTGILQDTYVYNFEDKSISTHIVANNLGSDNTPHDSGTAVVGGIAGTVYAGSKDIHIKNVKMNIAEDKNLSALIDAPEVGKKAIVGGAFGIIDGSKKVYTEIVPINIKTGSLSIKSSNSEAGSYGSIYASGFIGYLASLGHELTYVDKLDVTLLDGNVDIQAINNGYGPVYAGGLFAYRALVIPNTSDDVDDMNMVVINSGKDGSTLTIKAEQSQSSRKIYDYSSYSYPLYDIDTGYFCGKLQNDYSLNNFKLTTNNASVTSQRSIGSTAIGNIFAGGLAGEARSDGSTGVFSNIDIILNNSSVNALSLSYESQYTGFGNNAAVGGFIGSVYKYGSVNNGSYDDNKSDYNFTWNSFNDGIKNVNLDFNNFGNSIPDFNIHCIQNAKSGSSDYHSEGYAGGFVGLFDASYVYNVSVKSPNQSALIYYNGTNTPNTASAGGLIGQTKDSDSASVGIRDIEIRKLQVVAKAYADRETIGNGSPTDIYVGGAVGTVGTEGSSNAFLDDIHVFDTIVRSVGEEKMSTYAGGVVGGIWWKGTSFLQNSSFVSGTVYASSITQKASAGGILGFSQRGRLYNNVILNSYVNAESNNSTSRAAGIIGETNTNPSYAYNNYSQSYINSDGKTSISAGILCGGGNVKAQNNIFDLASYGTNYLNDTRNAYAINNTSNADGNGYVVLYENNNVGYSSLELHNRSGNQTFREAPIYSAININTNTRMYMLFEGDDVLNRYNQNNVRYISAYYNVDGLVISSLWINIYGETIDGVDKADLTEENGWYSFCSYPIKVNHGRPIAEDDYISVILEDGQVNGSLIEFEYDLDSNGLPYVKDDAYAVTANTNVAGYYDYESINTQYVLVNIGQNGLSENDSCHIASSIKINSKLLNGKNSSYINFPKYSFYESKTTSNEFDIEETKWTVPYVDSNSVSYKTLFENRINSIMNSKGNKTYSSNFNGRLTVDRLLDQYALVISPDSNLDERTIIIISFDNPKENKTENVIIEFVPNIVAGVDISPADDTPALEVDESTDRDDNGIADTTYTFVAGDTVRFEAFERKRYNQFSFLSTAIFTDVSNVGLKSNGTIIIPNNVSLFEVNAKLLSDENIKNSVYVRVLQEISYSITTDGADYASDRKAVQETPFSFEFSAAPGFGSDPDMVRIATNNTTIDLHGSELYYSTTESYTTTINGCIVKFDHHTGTYYVTIPSSIMSSSVTSLSIILKFPVVYSIVFDTGIPNVDVNERYIVFEMEQGAVIDNLFYSNTIYPAVFLAIKDARFGFALHDYYLTDDASTIPRYGETIATMVTPAAKVEDDVILYYYFASSDNTEIRVVQDLDSKVWYLDNNLNNILDDTEKTDSNRYNGWRTVTGPYTFYARWTYDIAIEIPDGITVSSPLSPDRIINLDVNDEDIANGKLKLIPINTNNGFSFTITTDSSYQGVPRFKLYEVTEGDGTIDYVYKDITEYVSLIAGSNNSYNIPQYDELGNSIINGVLFLKVFNDATDFEVADIGEFGKVSTNNSIYEDGIFTITYSINYSSVVIDGVEYKNGLPVGHGYTVAENNLSFDFINKDGTDLYLPENTSFRLYRKINDDAYDAGLFINSTPISEIKLSDFINISTGSVMKVTNDLFIKNEEYDLVVTLPLNVEGFNEDHKDAKVIVHSTYIESYRQFDYTLTYGYDSNGNLIAVHPESYDVLQSPTRHESFKEKAYDIFNVFDSIPSSGEVTYANGRFSLTFNEGTYVDGVDDHRHSNKYYLWEISKPDVSLPAGYIVSYNDGKTAEFVSETQHHYYYLATNGNLILANAQENCTIRLLEVDSLANPAAGIVIYTYSAN